MRVAIVDAYYPAFQAQFYGRHPEVARLPYHEQREAVLVSWFGTGDSYSHWFRELGHEAEDLLVNVSPLQLAWARENGRGRLANPLLGHVPGPIGRRAQAAVNRRIALAQIAALDPQVVFSHNLGFFTRADLDRLRSDGRFVAGQVASPLPPWDLVEGFDFVATSFPHFVERLRSHGVESEYLKLAFDERLTRIIPESNPASERPDDVVFVGGVDPSVHPAGTALLEQICEQREVAVYGYGADALPASSAIRKQYRGEAWGLDMYRALARAKVALNRHIDVAEGHANNMRLYEATGMGAALLTDRGSNLAELFEPEREVAVYDDAASLVARLDALLDDEQQRVAIARAGHDRTLGEHTWSKRIAELAAMLERAG
jgi:hypothetical protein